MFRIFVLSGLFIAMLLMHMQVMIEAQINPASPVLNLFYFLSGVLCFASGLAIIRVILGEIGSVTKPKHAPEWVKPINAFSVAFAKAKETKLFGPNNSDPKQSA